MTKAIINTVSVEGARLGLTVGQELTQEQINNLNEDIVWYVTKQVNGIEVLTPQVYLSKNTRSIINDDTRNRVGGINGTYVKTKDFVNDGTKWGNGGVTYVEANTVRNETATNLLSEISGDRTFINAVGNIENIGGRINGEEAVALISEKGDVINNTTKRNVGYNNGEYDRTHHEEVASIGAITSKGAAFIKADSYNSTGGMLNTDHLALDVSNVNLNALSLSGEDKFGSGGSNFSRYSETTHLGAGISADSAQGTVGDMNLKGSSFIAKDTTGLAIGNVKAESAVNSYDMESRQSSRSTFSSGSSYRKSHTEENSASNLMLGKNAVITGNVEGIGSNIVLGENTSVGGKVTTDSRQLHSNYYEENKKKGFSGGISHGTASLNYGKSQSTYDEKSTVNAKSNLQIGDGSVLNRGAEITATNFEYGNIQINNGDVKYGARIDTRDVKTASRSSNFGVSVGINSPIKDRIKQAAGAVSQVKNGDTAGGAMEAINAAAGTINGLALNQGSRQTSYDSNGSVGKEGAKNAMANSNFYANIGVNAGFTRSRSNSSAHTEGAAVTTLKPMNENSSITYNNVNSITYQGTQAQGGTFIYNNVANIQKEAVELHNSYSSSSSSRGINAGATIGYGHKIQTTGNGGSISSSRSNQNTVETIYANGNFKNVNEVHNNTGSMVLNGFNQEGGKVTGNIGKVEVISRQNTSTTTGSSRGISVGVSANGVPSSVNINGSRTNGDRAFVDNQSTFIVGEGSSLHVGTLENTGAVIGKKGNSAFKIDNYVGKDIQNHDTMKTTGGSIGVSTGNLRLTNIGVNQDSRDKQGITRNTVVGDVEIAGAEGSPINRDLGKANEVTKDTHSSTNINVESQTIEYLTNPGKLKEDIGKAKEEINDIKWAIDKSIHDMGDDNRNFFGQLSEVRLSKTIDNITHERLKDKKSHDEIADTFKDAYKDLGYDINIIFSDPKNSPQLLDEKGKPKTGTAYVRDENGKKIKTIIINGEDPKNATKAGLIGTIVEEGSHVIGKVEGRQRKTGTDEKGLESTGRASNEYFTEKYKEDNPNITIQSDGKDYSNVDFGENVGDHYPGYGLILKAKKDVETQTYRLGDQKFLDDLKLFSTANGLASPYFGFYYLPKEIQKKYFGKVKDKNGNIAEGLVMNRFDPKGYQNLINSKEYTIAMHKANLVSLESAYAHFEKNGLKPGTFDINNKRFSQNFASQSEIAHIKTRLGLGQIVTNADGLNITLREASVVGHTRIVVSKPNKKGEQFVTITRYTRIADDFTKPYDLKWGLPYPFETGTEYGLMSDYEDHDIFVKLRYVVKGKSPKEIKNEVKNSMNIGKNNAINNLNRIDPWEYKHFLKNLKDREAKRSGKKW